MKESQRRTDHLPHDSVAAQLRDISLRELLQWHGFEIKPEGITFVPRTTAITWLLPEIAGSITRSESEEEGRLTFKCT